MELSQYCFLMFGNSSYRLNRFTARNPALKNACDSMAKHVATNSIFFSLDRFFVNSSNKPISSLFAKSSNVSEFVNFSNSKCVIVAHALPGASSNKNSTYSSMTRLVTISFVSSPQKKSSLPTPNDSATRAITLACCAPPPRSLAAKYTKFAARRRLFSHLTLDLVMFFSSNQFLVYASRTFVALVQLSMITN